MKATLHPAHCALHLSALYPSPPPQPYRLKASSTFPFPSFTSLLLQSHLAFPTSTNAFCKPAPLHLLFFSAIYSPSLFSSSHQISRSLATIHRLYPHTELEDRDSLVFSHSASHIARSSRHFSLFSTSVASTHETSHATHKDCQSRLLPALDCHFFFSFLLAFARLQGGSLRSPSLRKKSRANSPLGALSPHSRLFRRNFQRLLTIRNSSSRQLPTYLSPASYEKYAAAHLTSPGHSSLKPGRAWPRRLALPSSRRSPLPHTSPVITHPP